LYFFSKGVTLKKMNVDDLEVADLLNAAKIAETAERFEDMCAFMNKLVKAKFSNSEALTVDERNLLSVAYKNVVGTKRQSWRMLSQGNFGDLPDKLLDQYRSIIEKELEVTCGEVIKLLKQTTEVSKKVESENSKEDLVFYLKMIADYYRYLSEFMPEGNNQKAKDFYEQATDAAKDTLPETHPTLLGLALNYSVCCYEILNEKQKACDIAKKAFDSAIEKLDTLNDSSYKDSTLIMQLLRDNLTLWTAENEDETQNAE
jgi:hypothetical protein